jgi:hypothetical protein
MKFFLRTVFVFVFTLSIINGFSQLDSYTVTRTAPNCACYTDIAGTGTAVTSWRNGTSTDDNLSNTLNIGFNFPYDGAIHSQFRVSTEGFITFNIATNANGADLPAFGVCSNTIEAYTYDNTKFTTSGKGGTLATVAPFYNDLFCRVYSLNSSIHYLLSGSAPNRILTVQWRGMANDWSGDSDCSNTGGNLNFQVKLYETSGNIEFYYSTMTQTTVSCSGSGTYSISNTYTSGINSSTLSGAPTITQLITQQTANTATFNNTAQNGLTTLPSANSRIIFTRTAPPAPGAVPGCALINYPANAATNQCLNAILSWGNTGGVPTGYDVFFGTAATPPLVSANQGSHYYNPGALATNTTYYWKIVPKNGFGDATGCSTLSFSTANGDVSPSSITSSAGNPICVGTTTTLSIVGGSTSEGSVFNWTAPFVFNLGCKVNPSYPLLSSNCKASSYTNTYTSPGTYRYDVFVRGCNGTTSCVTYNLVVNDVNNTPPTGATSSAGNPICLGTTTTLTATGGTLGAGATTQWYTGSCGGTSAGTGTSVSVTPGSTGTIHYYVRRTGGTGPCPNSTSCYDYSLVVQANIGNNTASTSQTICSGQTPATLTGTTPTGGSGTYTYQWQSSTDGVSFAAASGTNNAINYSPPALTQTTWYRRSVSSGACSPNISNVVQITVNPVPSAAGSISGTASVCAGQNGISYSVGAISGATSYTWTLPSGASIATGSGTNSITVNFSGSASSGNITVSGTNSCGSGASSSFPVTVSAASSAPTGANASPSTVCSGGSSTLTVTGGSLGAGASWNWYTGSCGGTLVGTGGSISVTPTSTTTYYVRAQGTCNTTTCVSVTVTVPSNGGTGTWTWQGSIDNNWFNPCNWDTQSVPDGLSDVVIPGATTFQPLISGAIGYCKTRTINVSNGGSLTINTATGGQCIVTF